MTESAIHAAMSIESGVPTVLGLFCEVNSSVLGLTYRTLTVHELLSVGRGAPPAGAPVNRWRRGSTAVRS